MLLQPRDLDPDEFQIAQLRAAVDDYGTEAAILLVNNAGHWLHELAAADLITVDYDDDPEAPPTGQPAGIGWAAITWTDLAPAIGDGRIVGSAGQLRVLRAAASLADGTPVPLGDLAARLGRANLRLLLAAIANAGGSHEHRATSPDGQLGEALAVPSNHVGDSRLIGGSPPRAEWRR